MIFGRLNKKTFLWNDLGQLQDGNWDLYRLSGLVLLASQTQSKEQSFPVFCKPKTEGSYKPHSDTEIRMVSHQRQPASFPFESHPPLGIMQVELGNTTQQNEV
jgi:hypothetical protein